MIPVVTPVEMAAIDASAPEPLDVLIERAGRAVAAAAIDLLGGTYGRVVNVVVGKGNNGADGRVAARRLEARGVKVRVIDAAMRPPVLRRSDLVIDAAYGTGFRGEWIAPEVGDALVLAVDIPSGVDALTGEAGAGVLPADRTITFQALKPGLLLGDGARLAGHIDVADIGLDVSGASQHQVTVDDVAEWWPTRAIDAHKWNGAVKVIGGSPEMPGAAVLASTAAARAGGSLVSLSAPGVTVATPPEIVQRHVAADDFSADALVDIHRFGALVIGPGLGRADEVLMATRACISDATVPVVIDGDGLFASAWSAEGPAPLLRDRELATVLTPHDGEFGVLTGSPPGADRVASVRAAAADLGCTLLLKGQTTIVASPPEAEADPLGGHVWFVTNGDQRLATAGSGDVLAGMIGSALAMGLDADKAAAASAWLHADAANRTPADGLLASDIVDAIPAAIGAIR
ncbi:NAD(P)H-hydrate dehydratase [Ilumatobacter coccineus]|uniref:Bifunctional NAD(P)H-hydrate repair enzyme n=1 Tax=Ilumatobacter coccineus (strain NBRC 103263 / KCTC 29153 / YM16-304) TaxID=1313172 RepID=A0A6C7E7S2_ILUCY|nr:NAD(P)H-hydrate dehydratase [Ilumatobacter coccineus]BAN01205.1 hypothetical protein YM304_08910 [Ilumatobacter coccineus YM16-304]